MGSTEVTITILTPSPDLNRCLQYGQKLLDLMSLLTEVRRASRAWRAAIWTAADADPSQLDAASAIPFPGCSPAGMPPASLRFRWLLDWEPAQEPGTQTGVLMWGPRENFGDNILAPDVVPFKSERAFPTTAGARADAIPVFAHWKPWLEYTIPMQRFWLPNIICHQKIESN